jgi:hypothetical protein
VNPGGEPERDESGLPPVDIEIPDDARELDRDVHAYYRELRAERRQQRGLRVRGSLAKDGIVLPLLACCLILALITGTLLTVFTATSDQNLTGPFGPGKPTVRPPATSHAPSGGATSAPAGSSTPAGAGAASPTPEPGIVPGLLPRATLAVAGQALPVQQFSQAALVLVPPQCNCAATVGWLIGVVAGARAQPYLVYTTSTQADVVRLYASLSRAKREAVMLAAESDLNNLLRESIPGNLPEDGLAAILIGPKKDVLYAAGLGPKDDPTSLIKALTH